MRLAAIDLGSNSFRLEIAKVENDMILSEGSWKETVRLAAGIDSNGELTAEAQERALAALSRIAEKIREIPTQQIRAVGTQTLRAAANSKQFLKKAKKTLGCDIEILSGMEEARLVFEGCSFALPASKKKRLIVDIGGGSTECVVGRNRNVMVADSFHVGCVSTTVRFFKDGQVTRHAFQKAQVEIEAELEGEVEKIIKCGWDEAFGSSGTAAAISEIFRISGWSDGCITLSLLNRLKEEILKAGTASKFSFEGMREDRREVLAGGTAVMLAVFNKLRIKEMRPAGGALRYGILYNLAGRKLETDPRSNSVASLAGRLNADKKQADRVETVAVKLFEELNPEADAEDIRKLRWVCQLHEVGLSVARSDYHKHSAYLVNNSDIPGFSRSEQEKMSEVILGHRGNLKKASNCLKEKLTTDMLFCLRMAVILCHARTEEEPPLVKIIAGRKSFTVGLPQAWLDEHPLIEYLISQEEEIWAKVGYQIHSYTR